MAVDEVFKGDRASTGNKGGGKSGGGQVEGRVLNRNSIPRSGSRDGGCERERERNADRHKQNAQAKSSVAPTAELNLLFDVCTTSMA